MVQSIIKKYSLSIFAIILIGYLHRIPFVFDLFIITNLMNQKLLC